MHNATQWSLERFKQAGFKDAFLEEYASPKNWLPNIEKGEIITPRTSKNTLRIAAMPFSASTPLEGSEAEVYAIQMEIYNIWDSFITKQRIVLY